MFQIAIVLGQFQLLLHYDMGTVTARALARDLMAIRAPDMGALRLAYNQAIQLHFRMRARLIQSHYDRSTHHGTDPHQQRIWKGEMTACLANPRSTQIHGYLL